MRWDSVPRKLHLQTLEQWYGSHHHDFSPAEMHALIGVAALAAVGAVLGFVVWSFW